LFERVEARTRELAKSLEDLRTAQDRLVQTQKLASLGQLTAAPRARIGPKIRPHDRSSARHENFEAPAPNFGTHVDENFAYLHARVCKGKLAHKAS
jgi:hypothetical protein